MTATPATERSRHRFIPRVPRTLREVTQWLVLLMPPLMYIGKAPVDVACSLVVVLFLWHSWRQKDGAWLKAGWVRACLLFWVFLMVHSCFQSDALHSLSRAAPWGRYPLFAAALAFWVVEDARFVRRFFFSLILACLLLAGDAWVQYITGESLTGHEKWSRYRLSGPYNMPRLGYTLAWIVVPVLAIAMAQVTKGWKAFLASVTAVVVLSGAVVLTGDRSPTALLLLAMGLLMLLLPHLRRYMVVAGLAGLLAVVALCHFQPQIYARYVGETQQHLGRFWNMPYGRLVLDSRDIVSENPLLGVGVKEYRHVSKGMREPQIHPHNTYLEMATETGLVGLALLLGMFAVWGRDFIRSYPLWRGDVLMTGLLVAVLVRLWPVIFTPSFYSSWNAIPLWFMLGGWYGLYHLRKQAGSTTQMAEMP